MIDSVSIAPERLAIFSPFSRLADDQRILLSHQLSKMSAVAGSVLVNIGDTPDYELFLLKGTVRVCGEQNEVSVNAGDARSSLSLVNLRPSPVQLVAKTDVDYFLVNADLLQSLQSENITSDFNNPELMAGSSSHPVVLNFYKALMNNRLELPSLPEISQRISRIITDDNLHLDQIATLIASDAALSAKLLRLANSPMYRGKSSVSSVSDALNRMGINAVRHLVLAFALKDKLKSNSPWIKSRMLHCWKQGVQLAALCYVLAKTCTKIPPEEAMLAGLMHNIGELPLLQFAEHYPELEHDPDYLSQILSDARGQAGAMILHRWNQSIPLITAVQHVDYWFYEPNDPKPTLADILLLARLHSLHMADRAPWIPAINQVPAYQKIAPGQLSDSMTLKLLDDAREQISEIRQLLSR